MTTLARRLLARCLAPLLVAGLAAGCGPTCRDACSRTLECAAKFSDTAKPTDAEIGACADDCDRDTVCRQKDAAIECGATIVCDTEENARAGLLRCRALCEQA